MKMSWNMNAFPFNLGRTARSSQQNIEYISAEWGPHTQISSSDARCQQILRNMQALKADSWSGAASDRKRRVLRRKWQLFRWCCGGLIKSLWLADALQCSGEARQNSIAKQFFWLRDVLIWAWQPVYFLFHLVASAGSPDCHLESCQMPDI